MKIQNTITIILLIFCLTSCQHGLVKTIHSSNKRNLASEEIIDLVFDLDWTLVSELKEKGQQISAENIVTVQGVDYRINDWALEMITELNQRPNVRISFFSGGNEMRNKELLSKLILMDESGKSFFDIAYKVKNFEDLYEVPQELVNGEKFTDRFKKDLTKINSDLDRLLLVEDNFRFAVNDIQKKNILWLGPTYIHYEKISNLPSLPLNPEIEMFVPKTTDDWFLARNKLLMIWGALDKSIDNKDPNILNNIETYATKVDFSSGKKNTYLDKLYNESYWKLKKVGFRKGRIPASNMCHDLIKVFF